jgi:hypothetical protein
MLGLGKNNWKMALGNFFIILGTQVAFRLDDIMNLGRYPTPFECGKIISNSLVITLIFYGYNRYRNSNGANVDKEKEHKNAT